MDQYKQEIRALYKEHMESHPCPLSVMLYRRLVRTGMIRGEEGLVTLSDDVVATMCRRSHVMRSQAGSSRLTPGVSHRECLYAIPARASRKHAFTREAKIVNRAVRPLAYLADQAMREVTLSWLACSEDERSECAADIELIKQGEVK